MDTTALRPRAAGDGDRRGLLSCFKLREVDLTQAQQWQLIVSGWQSFIKSEKSIVLTLDGAEKTKWAQNIVQKHDRLVLTIFEDIIKLLEHTVQKDEAQEMRVFLRTGPREVPIFDQRFVSSLDYQGCIDPGVSVRDQ